jgi:CheY-like chemotaxis protein
MGETAMDTAAVLLVSDRADLPLLLRGPCAARGLRLAWEPDAERGLGPAADAFRLVLLDAAMAGVDAPEAVRAFRGHSTLPVVVISLLTRAADPVATLDNGADDYVGGRSIPKRWWRGCGPCSAACASMARPARSPRRAGSGSNARRGRRGWKAPASISRRSSSTCSSTWSAMPAARCCATT